MADDQYFEIWDAEFLEEAIQLTEAAVCSSAANPTQPPPRPQPPPPPHFAPHISYSPPRELSQRVKEDNHRNFSDGPVIQRVKDDNHRSFSGKGFDFPVKPRVKEDNHRNFSDKGFDCPVSLNGVNQGCNSAPPFPHSSRLHDEDKCAKQLEINRLKEELGRVSKVLTNLEQECLELKKEKEKNDKHLKSVHPLNGFKDADAFSTNKPNLKNKDPIADHSVIRPGIKGSIPCKAVGVQTDEVAISDDLTIKKDLPVTCPSRKLAGIWELNRDQKPRNNLVSKLFVACEADLQVLFGCLGLNISSKKTATKMDFSTNHSIQAVEAAKVSHLYLTLTQISYDIGRLDDLLEALVDLCSLQNMMIVHRSLCVLHVVLKHILSMENRSCSRDNVILDDPSIVNKSSEKQFEMGNMLCENTEKASNQHHPLLTRLINPIKDSDNDILMEESSPLISSSKWFSLFQVMHQVVATHSEGIIRVEAVSIMNIILLRTDAYVEREMYGEVAVFQSISRLLKNEAGVGVQKQTVHLLYLLLNCPNLMSMFCSSCKEVGTNPEVSTANDETALTFQVSGAILDGLADCLACRGNGAPITLVLKLQRNAIILLAFLASSGRHGLEILLGRNLPRRTNFLYLILQILAYEIDIETSESVQPFDDFRERTLLIREALILLNRLASNSQYSSPVLRLLTSRRDTASLTVDIASRLSKKVKWLSQSDTMTRQTRESEIVDLARIFKKRVFTFLGDTTSEK